MKQLLYYDLDNKFVNEQVRAGGDGSKVVSVYNGIAWTEDSGVTYYRDNTTQKVTYNITVHYKNADLDADICEPDIIHVKSYSGCSATEMLYPKKFDNLIPSITEAYLTVSSDTEYTFFYKVEDFKKIPLTFKILSNGELKWSCVGLGGFNKLSAITKTISYRKNTGSWVDITSKSAGTPTNITVVAGDIVEFKGDNDCYGSGWTGTWGANTFSGSTCRFTILGNIMSLIDSVNFAECTELKALFAFPDLFAACTGLTDASLLELPAEKLSGFCYVDMFEKCTSLVATPKLPATTLVMYCYEAMFSECTALEVAPDLLASKLSDSNVYYAYGFMFDGCTNLKYIKCTLPFGGGENQCFAWVRGISQASGTFVRKKGVSWSYGYDGVPNGWTIIDEES